MSKLLLSDIFAGILLGTILGLALRWALGAL